MNRSRQALRLAEHLSRITGVPVELTHDSGARWLISWHDGPHREEMRAHLDTALADGDRYAAMRDRTIGCSRFQTRQAWAALAAAARRQGVLATAIAEIAVHKGEQESDEASALWMYVRQLWENTSYPERPGAPEDVPLVEYLVAASHRAHPSGRSGTTSELYMAQALLENPPSTRCTPQGRRLTSDMDTFATPSAERPPAPVSTDWAAVEDWLGLRLPADYKRLADRYGPLDFGEYVWIHVPCVQRERFDYGEWLHATHREARIGTRGLPEAERPVFHPEPGGLLAWGCTRGSDVLFWDTSASADPDQWTVVVRHTGVVPGSGLLRWHRYDLTLTDYLRHTVRDTWELPSPPGPLLGPLPGTFARTAFLPDAEAWSPPAPVPPRLTGDERRIALETGIGLDGLRVLSPPPERPYLGDGSWEGLFAELGTRLPGEYVRLMDEYGAGIWRGWLRFHTPLRTGERRFLTHVEDTVDAYRQLGDGDAAWYPLAVWPEPGGFLPFANSIDGDYLGWLTEGGDPDTWPLIVWPRHAHQGPPLDGGLIDTLLDWQRGTLVTRGLATLDEDDDPVAFAEFQPWDDRAHW